MNDLEEYEEYEEPETREELEKRYQKALEAAARQLSYRPLSRGALLRKLGEKGHAEDAAEYAAEWLRERGMLSDGELAESLLRGYVRRGYGPLRIRQELRRRGIGREDIDAAMAEFDADLDRMTALLDKRLRGDLSDRREVQKAIAALQRRGFLWDDIRRALAAYEESLASED